MSLEGLLELREVGAPLIEGERPPRRLRSARGGDRVIDVGDVGGDREDGREVARRIGGGTTSTAAVSRAPSSRDAVRSP